jgi:hypothetical protein
MCGPGTYTPGNYAVGQTCCCGGSECTKKPGTPNLFTCELTPKTGGGKTVDISRNTGATVLVFNDYTDLFSSPNPALCGTYDCTTITYKSGTPDKTSCMTSVANGATTFNSDTCTKFGSSVYTINCSAKPAFSLTYDPINVNFYDYCSPTGTVVSNTHALISKGPNAPGAGTSPLTDFLTIGKAVC